MKKTIRQSLALLLAGALLLLGMPFALAEAATHSDVDYSTLITVGTLLSDQIEPEDPHLDSTGNPVDWSGIAQGYTVALEAGVEYRFEVTLQSTLATYVNRAVAILPETLSGTDSDFLTYTTAVENSELVSAVLSYIPEVSGNYKLLSWGYCYNSDGAINGDATTIEILVEEKSPAPEVDYAKVDYSTLLTVGVPLSDRIEAEDLPLDSSNNPVDWSGTAQGYTVALEADVEYLFHVTLQGTDAAYVDRAIAILPEELSGVSYYDFLSYTSIWKEGNQLLISLSYTPSNSGNYKLLSWGYCDDINDNAITGDATALTVSAWRTDSMPTTSVEIGTKQDLLALAETLADDSGLSIRIVLTDDIDMTGENYTAPDIIPLSLTVWGDDHKITGLNMPLFNQAEQASFYDLTVDIALAFSGEGSERLDPAGAFLRSANQAYFINCHATGKIAFSNIAVVDDLGGLVGAVNGKLEMDGCTSSVDLTVDGVVEAYDIGGLVGGYGNYSDGAHAYVIGCRWQGTLTLSNVNGYAYSIGGLAGYMGNYAQIEKSSATGTISVSMTEAAAGSGYVGGLCGYLEDYNSINKSFASVTINAAGAEDVGGLAGYIDNENALANSWAEGSIQSGRDVGGLVGDSSCCGNNKFINCYSIADVTGQDRVGGIIGKAYNKDRFVNCYTTGTVALTEDAAENAVIGTFLGEDTSSTDSPLSFTNCYAFASDTLKSVGTDESTREGIASVDFSDDEAVSTMTQALVASVEEINNAGSENFRLVSWTGKNADNGPTLHDIDYTDVDYSTLLTVGTKNRGQLEDSLFIRSEYYGWEGTPSGYTVALEGGKEYLFHIAVSGNEAVLVDRAVGILSETLTGNEKRDFLFYQSDSVEGDACIISFTYTPETDGNYKLLAWGYCESAEGPLFGEDTEISVLVAEVPEKPDQTIDIKTEKDLMELQETLNQTTSIWPQINFLADLDMTELEYTPVSFLGYKLTVSGGKHTVSGLKAPLFDQANHLAVSDLTVKADLSLSADPESEGWIEDLGLLAGKTEDFIATNFHVIGSITLNGYNGISDVGGLVGDVNGLVQATDCTADVDFSADSATSLTDLGGLIGLVDNSYKESFLSDCHWEGTLECAEVKDDVSDIGGLVGDIEDDLSLLRCSATGSIRFAPAEDIYMDNYEDSVGGLVGRLSNYNRIDSCWAEVEIDAPFVTQVGGLVGYMDEANLIVNSFSGGSVQGTRYVGGLIGASICCGSNKILNSYSTADVAGENMVGGLMGAALNTDAFDNCYATGTVSLLPTSEALSEEGADPEHIGTFLGILQNYGGEEDPIPFGNCFAFADETLRPVGNLETVSGITTVDFSDDEAVAAMTAALNEAVEANNEDTEVNVPWLTWDGKNQDNGPIFLMVTYGDVDGNSKVDAADALKALQHAVKLVTLEDNTFVAADVNGDDKVDATDALLMLQYTVKLIDIFPVQK